MSKFYIIPFTSEDVWHARHGEFIARIEQALHIALLKVAEDPEARIKKIVMVEVAFYINEPVWQKILAAKATQYEDEALPFDAEEVSEKSGDEAAGNENNDLCAGSPCVLFMSEAAMRMIQDLGIAINVVKTVEREELPASVNWHWRRPYLPKSIYS